MTQDDDQILAQSDLHSLLQERGEDVSRLLRASLVGDYLGELFSRRKRDDAAYSLRAFARDLGLDATDLSKALRHQKSLAPKTVSRVAAGLGLTSDIAKLLIASAALREF